jgi:hypothetical protein
VTQNPQYHNDAIYTIITVTVFTFASHYDIMCRSFQDENKKRRRRFQNHSPHPNSQENPPHPTQPSAAVFLSHLGGWIPILICPKSNNQTSPAKWPYPTRTRLIGGKHVVPLACRQCPSKHKANDQRSKRKVSRIVVCHLTSLSCHAPPFNCRRRFTRWTRPPPLPGKYAVTTPRFQGTYVLYV